MSALEFVITLHLIVIGLAMTNLLSAIGDLFKYRERIDYTWLLPVWLLAMLFAGLALAFGIRQTESTISPSATIFDVLPYFQYTVFLYLGCRILNPELAHRTHLDLDAYFLSIRKPFFAFSFIPQAIFFLSLAATDTPLPPLPFATAVVLMCLAIVGFVASTLSTQRIVLALWIGLQVSQEIVQSGLLG